MKIKWTLKNLRRRSDFVNFFKLENFHRCWSKWSKINSFYLYKPGRVKLNLKLKQFVLKTIYESFTA